MAPFTGDLWDAGESSRQAAELILRVINEEAVILPGFRLRLVYQDSRCSGARASEILLENVVEQVYYSHPMPPHEDINGDGRISGDEARLGTRILSGSNFSSLPVALLGPGCTAATIRVVKMAHTLRLPMISGLSTLPVLSNRTEFPNFFRTITSDAFANSAICSLTRLLGLQRLFPIVGDFETWGSLAEGIVHEAENYGVELVGRDLGTVVPGLRGATLSVDSWEAAFEVVQDVRRATVRTVSTMMYSKRFHMILCAQVQLGLPALLWYRTLLDTNVWTVPDFSKAKGAPVCTTEEILGAANGVMAVLPNMLRQNLDSKFACANGVSTGDFRREFYSMQNQPYGQDGRVPAGYILVPEAVAVVDTVCMYALALREMLITNGRTVAELASRSREVYKEFVDVLGHTEFEGLQGRLKFTPGYADSSVASVRLLQLQAGSSPCSGTLNCSSSAEPEVADIAVFSNGTFQWTEGNSLKYHLPSELFRLPPAAETRLAEFQQCSEGLTYDPFEQRCRPCPEGRTFVSHLGGCVCTRGYHKQGTECLPCGPGRFSTQVSVEECAACPRGRAAAEEAQEECKACTVGSFVSEEGASACLQCSDGRPRPHLWTTMQQVRARTRQEWTYAEGSTSQEDCGCDRGARTDSTGECIPCGEGLDCRGMDSIQVLPGYYSDVNISIFKCYGEHRRCTGGAPGHTCNEGRVGIACAECQSGLAAGGSGTCEGCSGTDLAPLLAMSLVIFGSLCASYWVWSRSKTRVVQSSTALACVIAGGQLLTAVQILGVVAIMPLNWWEPMKSTIRVLEVLSLDLEIFRLGCVSNFGALSRFILRLTLIFTLIVMVIVIHLAAVIFWYRRDFKNRRFAFTCTLGTLLAAFYIGVVSTVLAPLQCEYHPNDLWTTRQYQSVICWASDDHWAMLVSGLMALLLIPLPYMAFSTLTVWQFPNRMRNADVEWLHQYAFLFFRSRPQTYWFFIVHCGRSLLVACVPVLPSAPTQILALQLLMFVSLGVAARFRPWRSDIANSIEILVSSTVMFLCSLASFFVEVNDREFMGLSAFCLVLTLSFLVPMPLLLLRMVVKYVSGTRKRYQYFLCHHKAGAGAFTRLVKMLLLETKRVTGGVFIDSDDLENLSSLFEVVYHDTGTLIVIASRQVFHRPWCVGEMTMARLSRIPSMVVAHPSALLPSEEMMSHYSRDVPDLDCLSAENITLDDVLDTLSWVHELPLVEAPTLWSKDSLQEFTGSLCGREAMVRTRTRGLSSVEDGLETVAVTSFILCDPTDHEATAAALVLQKMLAPHFLQKHCPLPRPLAEGEELPEKAQSLVILLSEGLLSRPSCLDTLASAVNGELRTLPVTLQETFRFPSQADLENLQRMHGERVATAVQSVLREISVPFQPQHAPQRTLEVGAMEVSRRLTTFQPARSITRTGTMLSFSSMRDVKRGSGHRTIYSPSSSRSCTALGSSGMTKERSAKLTRLSLMALAEPEPECATPAEHEVHHITEVI